MSITEHGWREIAWRETRAGDHIANTWEMPYRGGWLVLHASPTGAETMVFVPDTETTILKLDEATT